MINLGCLQYKEDKVPLPCFKKYPVMGMCILPDYHNFNITYSIIGFKTYFNS